MSPDPDPSDGVHLALHALRRGYEVDTWVCNVRQFDPTWFQHPTDLRAKLRARITAKGLITGVDGTYLYQCIRETEQGPDDVRGDGFGHFLVLCGYRASVHRVIGAIFLGVGSDDGNLLRIRPKNWQERRRAMVVGGLFPVDRSECAVVAVLPARVSRIAADQRIATEILLVGIARAGGEVRTDPDEPVLQLELLGVRDADDLLLGNLDDLAVRAADPEDAVSQITRPPVDAIALTAKDPGSRESEVEDVLPFDLDLELVELVAVEEHRLALQDDQFALDPLAGIDPRPVPFAELRLGRSPFLLRRRGRRHDSEYRHGKEEE